MAGTRMYARGAQMEALIAQMGGEAAENPVRSRYVTAEQMDRLIRAAGGAGAVNMHGKIVSILGDSISTYTGWIPVDDGHNITHRARYPDGTSFWHGTVEDTWWMKLISDLGAKLGINDSWAGSRVSNSSSTDTGDVGPNACMAGMTRITNLGMAGTPDLILFYGGTNDCGVGITPGTFDSTATYTLDTTSTTWSNFATAYKDAIMRLQYCYPHAKLVVLLPTYTTSYYAMDELDKFNEIIKEVCDYFGVDWIDLRRCGINQANASEMLGDGTHPTEAGFVLMEKYILAQLSAILRLEAGENTAHSIVNDLTGCSTDKAYIRGVDDGEAYSATITGFMAPRVRVSMGGVDITETAYDPSTGDVSIEAVTGDVVIRAAGEVTWYNSEISVNGNRNSSNATGYGWANIFDPYPYDVPINAVRFPSTSSSGTFEVGVVNKVGGTDITQVQSVAWTAANKDSSGLVTIILPTTFRVSDPELIVLQPETQPDYQFYYQNGSNVAEDHIFYTRIPYVHPGGSGTAWSGGTTMRHAIVMDFGYVSEE